MNKVLNVVYSYFFLQLFVKPNLFLSILFVVIINRTQWSSNLSPSHSNFPFGIISGRHWDSFTVEDHLRSILGIICSRGSFSAMYRSPSLIRVSFLCKKHLWRQNHNDKPARVRRIFSIPGSVKSSMPNFKIRDCAIIIRRGGWKTRVIQQKLRQYLPSKTKKISSNPPLLC